MLALANASRRDSSAQAQEVKKFRAFLDEDWKPCDGRSAGSSHSAWFPGQNRAERTSPARQSNSERKHLRESIATLKTIRRKSFPR